jgi:hypothetical protein
MKETPDQLAARIARGETTRQKILRWLTSAALYFVSLCLSFAIVYAVVKIIKWFWFM